MRRLAISRSITGLAQKAVREATHFGDEHESKICVQASTCGQADVDPPCCCDHAGRNVIVQQRRRIWRASHNPAGRIVWGSERSRDPCIRCTSGWDQDSAQFRPWYRDSILNAGEAPWKFE